MTDTNFAALTLPFGDDNHTFQLNFKAASEWEKQNERSLFETFNRMVETRHSRLDDIRSILHMGLVGGGKSPTEALHLIKRFVEDRPLSETHPIVLAVLEAFLFGNDEYRKEKGDGDGKQ